MMTQKAPSTPGGIWWLTIWTLTERELVRFFRQRTRVVGALGQPVLFWVLFGAGLRGSFQPPAWAPPSMTYQEYFFPGVAVLIVMFTAIFSTISIIEDRREGFLQGVLVAPISRLSLVLGKLCGGTVLAVLQAGLFLVLAPWMGISFTLGSALAVAGFLTLIAFTLTALGFLIAWPLDSTQGFHAIMSVFLMPMWLLSGSFFPAGDSGWLSWVIRVNPLTYGVAGLRRLLYWREALPAAPGLPSLGLSLGVMCLFCLACVTVAVWLTQRRTSRDAR
jgi:ABC-2 type transport system permease protein